MSPDRSWQPEHVLDGILGPPLLRTALHPIVSSTGRGMLGHEALMRGPKGSPYESPPLAFAMAATLGAMERLDCYCIRRALSIQAEGLLFVNVHPRTVTGSESFWEIASELSAGSPAETERLIARAPSSVVFEIVEHSVNHSDLPRALLALRALGFRIAVDDLGEGAAGLRRLIELAPDYAKIDHFFIRDIDRDVRRRAVVRAVLAIAEDCGTTVIAEGVETAGELKALSDLGVEWVQGYYFGRPEEVAA